MLNRRVPLSLAVALPALALALAGASRAAHPMAKMTDAQIIASAMQAAPAAIAKAASIVELSAHGAMRVVRTGSHGCPCMADSPATPRPDPGSGGAACTAVCAPLA